MEPVASNSLHNIGDTVFVPYEGGKHYAARIIKKELRKYQHEDGSQRPMWHYLVHYMGWNKKYDEWVEEIGCRTDNPDQVPLTGNKRLKTAQAKPGKAVPQMSIAIPPKLKQQLVADHDAIKKESKLLPLPRAPCVEEILDSYSKAHSKKGVPDSAAEQVANGLRAYFDRCLALLLLYSEERAQADSFIADGTLPSAVYGAEHLLRLFVKLPEYLPVAGSTEEQYRVLQAAIHEVLDFMQSKLTEFFVPPAEYVVLMQE